MSNDAKTVKTYGEKQNATTVPDRVHLLCAEGLYNGPIRRLEHEREELMKREA
jgi:hypothetical protein